jgi:HK97 gp10 family phage protein
MAEQVGIRITADVPGLEEIRKQILGLGNTLSAKYMASALRSAAEKGGAKDALKAATPRGPTGNLRRSIAIKSKRYPRTGIGIAILGFRSGRKMNEPYNKEKLGYHQGLVEFGTKERFRRTDRGTRASTGKMPIGGSYGRPPIRSAWEQTREKVESFMLQEMKTAFENAVREVADKAKSAQGPF